MAEGLENCVVLHRELVAQGYDGGYSILKGYVSPRRGKRQPEATMRFETAQGEQAQVDWGSLSYLSEDGKRRSVWVFVMTLGWSRACYVELVRRADTRPSSSATSTPSSTWAACRAGACTTTPRW